MSSRKHYTIEDMKRIAKEKDTRGQCLSTEYGGLHYKLLWKCGNPAHPPFYAEPNSVKGSAGGKGSWCVRCYHERVRGVSKKFSKEYLDKLAASRGGKCLSPTYSKEKLLWECREGHVFEITLQRVIHRLQWCPKCKPFRDEELTRQIISTILGCTFKKTIFMKIGIPEGGRIELDGYCEEKRIAFEYNGAFHYRNTHGQADLARTQRTDAIKKDLCEKHGIKLLVVREFPRDKRIDHWELIETALRNEGIGWEPYERNLRLEGLFYKSYKAEIAAIVEKRGGKLISEQVINATTGVEVECERGHRFIMTPQKLKQGQWCRHAMRNRRLTEAEVVETLRHYGGTLVKEYMLGRMRWVTVKCQEGHVFDRSIRDIRLGLWCNDPRHSQRVRLGKYRLRSDGL